MEVPKEEEHIINRKEQVKKIVKLMFQISQQENKIYYKPKEILDIIKKHQKRLDFFVFYNLEDSKYRSIIMKIINQNTNKIFDDIYFSCKKGFNKKSCDWIYRFEEYK